MKTLISMMVVGAAFFSGVLLSRDDSTLMPVRMHHILSGSWDGPLEAVVQNRSQGSLAMAELRVINDRNCAMDLGSTGGSYNNPSDRSVEENKGFLVSESKCAGMQIKANRGPVELVAWQNRTSMRLGDGRMHLSDTENCPAPGLPAEGAALCVSKQGEVWISTKLGSTRLIPQEAGDSRHLAANRR